MPRVKTIGILIGTLLLLSGLSAFAVQKPRQYKKEIAPYIAFLKTQNCRPVDYIMRLFEKYDIVILCERFHPETTQYDLIYSLASDKRFIAKIGNIFTEIGTSTNNGFLHDFMSADGLSDAEAEKKVMYLYRNLYWSPIWEKYNFFNFLKRLYALNRSLPAGSKINISFSDMPFSWESMTKEKYQLFKKSLGQRDQIMAEQIITGFNDVLKSTQPRKKALVIMNYRHAFNDNFKKLNGEKVGNSGRFIFEAFPGKVANIMINSVALLPGTNDQKAIIAPISDGKWDAAFEAAGNPDLGFDFKGNAFGADHFDYFPFFNHDYKYQDIFTGFVFYKPLEKHRMLSGIPNLFDDGYDKIILERVAITGESIEKGKAVEIMAEIGTLHESTYDDLPALMDKIRGWLSHGKEN